MSIASPNVPETGGRALAASPSAPPENLLQRVVANLMGRRAFWVIFVLIAFSWPVSRVIHQTLPPKLPVLGTVGAFELVDQNGRAFGTAELEGRVWVMSVIETSSPSADGLAKALGKIQHRVRNLGTAFHVVTMGLDPATDTPERLLDFTSRHRVSPRIWSFLSGDPEKLRRAQAAIGLQVAPRLAASSAGSAESSAARQSAALQSAARQTNAAASLEGGGPLSVAVVDGKMRVRGRYDLSDPTAIDTLLYHVGLLVNRGD